MRYPLAVEETIDFVCPCDPAVCLPDIPDVKKGLKGKKLADAIKARDDAGKAIDDLVSGYLKDPDPSKLTYEPGKQPIVWQLSALSQAAHRYAAEEWHSDTKFQYRIAALGVRGVEGLPEDFPTLRHKDHGIFKEVDPEWIGLMPHQVITYLSAAILRMSGRDDRAEKNLSSLFVKSK